MTTSVNSCQKFYSTFRLSSIMRLFYLLEDMFYHVNSMKHLRSKKEIIIFAVGMINDLVNTINKLSQQTMVTT
jgi:hypothetical protein